MAIESWEEFLATRQTDNKTGNKKPRGFVAPDRYTPEWQSNTIPLSGDGSGVVYGSEVQIEGDYNEPTQQAPPSQPVTPPPDPTSAEWQIDILSIHGTRALSVQAYHPGRNRTINFNMEAYFESNINRAEVANVLRSLVRLYEDKGVEVTTPRRAPKPELIEEMYQLLSIMMEDPAFGKYSQQWATVRTQVESQ